MLHELLKKNRSYRRFDQNERIETGMLEQWIENCRYCPSGRNLQALKYIIVNDPDTCQNVFPQLAWAGYLKDWNGPEDGERPSAYIIQLLDTELTANCLCDDGIQLQTLLLSAVECGYGGCIIKSFKNLELRSLFALPESLQIQYVLALGRPIEKIVLEDVKNEDVRYWRSPDHVHHVPKRCKEELIYKLY